MKVVVTQATAPLDGVVGVVPKSGPSFAPAALARCGAPFAQAMGTAEARVAAGEPEALLDVEAPIRGQMGAAAFVDKYGPGGRYDWVGLLEGVAVPTLVILGGADPSPLVGWARETVQRWPEQAALLRGPHHARLGPRLRGAGRGRAVALRRARRRLVGARGDASARPTVNRGRGGIRRPVRRAGEERRGGRPGLPHRHEPRLDARPLRPRAEAAKSPPKTASRSRTRGRRRRPQAVASTTWRQTRAAVGCAMTCTRTMSRPPWVIRSSTCGGRSFNACPAALSRATG